MKNKFKAFFLLCTTLIIMVSCSGSKELQKSWQGEDAEANVYSIEIKDKELTISTNEVTEKKKYKKKTVVN